MKQNKIFCDMCGKEAQIEKDGGLAIFENVTVVSSLSFAVTMNPNTEKGLSKESFDICENCAKKIKEFINSEKNKK